MFSLFLSIYLQVLIIIPSFLTLLVLFLDLIGINHNLVAIMTNKNKIYYDLDSEGFIVLISAIIFWPLVLVLFPIGVIMAKLTDNTENIVILMTFGVLELIGETSLRCFKRFLPQSFKIRAILRRPSRLLITGRLDQFHDDMSAIRYNFIKKKPSKPIMTLMEARRLTYDSEYELEDSYLKYEKPYSGRGKPLFITTLSGCIVNMIQSNIDDKEILKEVAYLVEVLAIYNDINSNCVIRVHLLHDDPEILSMIRLSLP